jgi:hypothetical protein
MVKISALNPLYSKGFIMSLSVGYASPYASGCGVVKPALYVPSAAATVAHPDDNRKKATASTYDSLDASRTR